MIYLGSLGRMIGIKCPASQNVQAEERHSFSTTLEGRRKAQVRQAGRRTWSLQTSDATTSSEHSLLSQFANGAWGPGPFLFVSADAPHTNILTPAVSMCDPADMTFAEGGPIELPDGTWAARSLLGDGVANVLFGFIRSPILSGQPVSAGAWVQGSNASTRLNWYDVTGEFIGSAVSSVASSGGWVWSTLTATPPAGAVGAIVSAVGASRATSPVLVWGESKPTTWVAGEGCAKAVVHVAARDLVLTSEKQTYSNLSFTVTEVG